MEYCYRTALCIFLSLLVRVCWTWKGKYMKYCAEIFRVFSLRQCLVTRPKVDAFFVTEPDPLCNDPAICVCFACSARLHEMPGWLSLVTASPPMVYKCSVSRRLCPLPPILYGALRPFTPPMLLFLDYVPGPLLLALIGPVLPLAVANQQGVLGHSCTNQSTNQPNEQASKQQQKHTHANERTGGDTAETGAPERDHRLPVLPEKYYLLLHGDGVGGGRRAPGSCLPHGVVSWGARDVVT